MKIVGKRRTSEDLTPIPPEEALRRAAVLQAQAELLNPFPRPRGFVFKARTREEYERWRKAPVQSEPLVIAMAHASSLLRVCQLLNEACAKYLICGAQACILHGLVRTTEDVDILVETSAENCQRVIDGLAKLADGAARELTPQDILENVVVKIADEVEVDVSMHAWKVTYADAIASARETIVEGIRVPFLGLDDLIASKETYRERDALDRARLLELKKRTPN